MQLILIRHAETDGNRLAYVGRQDLPLNDAGRLQAGALAAALSGLQPSAILSSPLVRARDTAAAIAGPSGVPVDVRPELVEIDFGHLQGQPKHAIPLDLKRLHRDAPLPGGESLRDVEARVAPLACEIRSILRDGGRLAVVSHYWTSRVLLGLMLNDPLGITPVARSYKPANASAFAIDFARSGDALAVLSTRWLHAAPKSQ